MLCLYRTGLEVSKMITGNTAPNLQVQAYQDIEDLNRHIDRFLTPFSPSSGSPMGSAEGSLGLRNEKPVIP